MSNSKNQNIRVRFAPSPTGLLHLGGMRSALFNWLYARKTAGVFMLRMEDTDRERYVPEAVAQIKASHAWLGITPDEIETQSDRLHIYRQYADELLSKGSLYPCWCTPERLAKLREKSQTQKLPFKYDQYCLNHAGDPKHAHVLRFKIPEQPDVIAWQDAVRGKLSFKSEDLDDFVALKSDGYPTYNFANVVDDHTMKISHVLRAEEFIPSTPKHLLLYQAFGWTPPIFAHLPQVLGPDGRSKLSKRHGAKSVLEYRDEGYLPDAVINFMALLGWNPGDGSTQELYTRDELVAAFSLERIQKSPAVFNAERLDWMNGIYIRQMPLTALLEASEPFWPAQATNATHEYKLAVLGLVQDRLKKLSELPHLTNFFFDYHRPNIKLDPLTLQWLNQSLITARQSKFNAESLEQDFRALVIKLNTTPKLLFTVLRQIITGEEHSPPLFETMAVLGQKTVIARLEQSLNIK